MTQTRSQLQAVAEIVGIAATSADALAQFLNNAELNHGFDSGEAITAMRDALARFMKIAVIAQVSHHDLCALIAEVNSCLTTMHEIQALALPTRG